MHKKHRTIYELARSYTDFTREVAAELLSVSYESLRDYESGKTKPASDIVLLMIAIYETPWLSYLHKTSDRLGEAYLPKIEIRDLPTSVLVLQKEMLDIQNISPDMIEITCDGRIDKHEKSKWQNVRKELSELAGAALSVLFAQEQKERMPVLAHRHSR